MNTAVTIVNSPKNSPANGTVEVGQFYQDVSPHGGNAIYQVNEVFLSGKGEHYILSNLSTGKTYSYGDYPCDYIMDIFNGDEADFQLVEKVTITVH